MRFWEAMKALEEGKKVRCKDWKEENVVPYPKTLLEKLRDEPGAMHMRIDFDKLIKTEWELYEPPTKTYNFMEILPGLKEGKSYRRPDWEKHSFIKDKGGCLVDETSHPGSYLLMEDFEATDWVETK